MILTLTPNPSVDQTVWVDRLEPGAVNRFHRSQLDPAGKGVNVSRLVHRLGAPTIAFGFLAGEIGLLTERALDEEGVRHEFVRVPGQTRANMTVIDISTGQTTRLFGAGPEIPAAARTALEDTLRGWLEGSRILVLAGTLPPGVPEDTYAHLIEIAKERGVRVALDADGMALRHGVRARPFLVKPNVAEAEHLLGRALPDRRAVLVGALEIQHGGVEVVVISMGAKGSVCVTDSAAWWAYAPAVARVSTVGSGDSFVAGFTVALARGGALVDALRLGTAAGAATARATGTRLGSAEAVSELVDQVIVEPCSA